MAEDQYLYGYHSVQTRLKTHPHTVLTLYLERPNALPKRSQDVLSLAQSQNIPIQGMSHRLQKQFQKENTQGVIALVKGIPALGNADLAPYLENEKPQLCLVLDGLQDPQNLGACLRSAAAFGVDAVILPKNNSAPLNATTCKVACGGQERLTLFKVTNLVRSFETFKANGFWTVGACHSATQPIDRVDMKGPLVCVLGAEGKGLRTLTRQHCDFLAQIPLPGAIECLNASVACGIFLYEAQRQAQKRG